jgi:excisionase family DNA binding protein
VELTFKIAGRQVPFEEFVEGILTKSLATVRQDVERLRNTRPPVDTMVMERKPDVRAVSIERAAELVGLSKFTIYKYASEGRLHSVRAGRRVLIPMETIERLLREGLPSRRQ